jgi:outer membrane protein OmpA-like peptidoglycan-associated protein
VDSSRLQTRGFGKKYPIAPNQNSDGSDNPAGRAKNRRVEVIIEN